MTRIFYPLLVLFLLVQQDGLAQDFLLEKLPDFINSTYDEISPVPGRDGKTLYFTRVAYPEFDRTLLVDSVDQSAKLSATAYIQFLSEVYTEINGKAVHDPIRSAFNQDIWIAGGDSVGQFTSIIHPGFPLNNALPNSLVATTPNSSTFYVINQYPARGGLSKGFSFVQKKSDQANDWTTPLPVEIKDYYTITSDVSLTMSFDGKVLILSAARHDSKEMDLYVCFREGPHQWSSPQHLGNLVNSSRRETTPFLSEDNVTLFFSSNRGESSGGNDIFMCKRLDGTWRNWSSPIRLVEPINSTADDSQPYFNMTSGYLYFSSRRGGNSDIYRVQIAPPQPTEIEVIGRVLNRKTGALMQNVTIRYAAPEETGLADMITSDNGAFRFKIPKGIPFTLTPAKPAFLGQTDTILLRRDHYYFQEYFVDLFLDPAEVNTRIPLQAIFFQQSKAIILESSYPELNRLFSVLMENPSLQIRIEGHTDNIGKAEDLMQLSEERAAAIREFLVQKGIASNRMEIVGHGPKFPLTDNSSDEQRQKNRRVEFVITKI
ncbi:MAG: OmpA family protein [Saprospiraceae bacterium]|nr:OmpA family protein [Saprospiraceae bacterium]